MADSGFARQAEEARVNLRAYAFLIGLVLAGSIYVNLEVTAALRGIGERLARTHPAAARCTPP